MIPRHDIDITWGSLLKSVFAGRRAVSDLKSALELRFKAPVILFQSGRGALYWTLRALPQETVVMPAYTCSVVEEAVRLAKKKIVYIDADPRSYGMDLADLEKKLPRDSIVIATHQFGIPCDMGPLMKLARRKKCVVLEDCAASFGSRRGPVEAGKTASAAFFSFEHTKAIPAGRGGFGLFNDPDLFRKVGVLASSSRLKLGPAAALRTWIRILQYKIVVWPLFYGLFIRWSYRRHGFTSNKGPATPVLDGLYAPVILALEASIALDNLRRGESLVSRRHELGLRYQAGLAGVKGLILPGFRPADRCSFMRYPLRVMGMAKKDFYEACLSRGLDLGFSFDYTLSRACPASRRIAAEIVNLAMSASVSDRRADRIVKIVKSVMESRK